MPKKTTQDPVEELAQLLSDPLANAEAISNAIRAQHETLVDIRDAAQASLEWLSNLRRAFELNRLEALVKKEKEKQGVA